MAVLLRDMASNAARALLRPARVDIGRPASSAAESLSAGFRMPALYFAEFRLPNGVACSFLPAGTFDALIAISSSFININFSSVSLFFGCVALTGPDPKPVAELERTFLLVDGSSPRSCILARYSAIRSACLIFKILNK